VHPRYVMAAVLLLALTVMPMYTGRNGLRWAYAETLYPLSALGDGVRAVASSNENEKRDQENRHDHGNNGNGNDNNNNNNNGNENDDDGGPPPPPPPRPAPPQPQNQASACLPAGGSVSLTLSDGTATMKVFQDNLNVELSRSDLPPAPGGLVGDLMFRVGASSCGGGLGTLPGEANLGVAYRDRVAQSTDENKYVLVFWDGQTWVPTAKQARDPGANFISATISSPGVYAVVQQ